MPACPHCGSELTALRRGGFLCEGCERRFDGTLAVVDAAPTQVTGWDDPAMPFPIAHPLARAYDASLPLGERFDAATFAAYQTIRLAGALLLSDYLASTVTSRKVTLATRALRAPDWWAWTVLSNQICRFFSADLDVPPDRDTAFPKLVAGWRSVNRKGASKKESRWGSLLDGLAGREGPATSANDALWRARDDQDERRRRGVEGGDEAALARIVEVVIAAATRLFPPGSLELVRLLDRAGGSVRLVRLHGAHADGRFPIDARSAEWEAPFRTSHVVAIATEAAVPVVPFFLRLDADARGAIHGGGGLLERMTTERGGRTCVLGGSAWPPAIVSPGRAVLRARGIDPAAAPAELTLSSLVPSASAATQAATSAIELYATRHVARAAFDVVEAALDAPGRALLVVGEPASGKTYLAARLAARALRRLGGRDRVASAPLDAFSAGDLVLFLSGRAALGERRRSPSEALARAVARAAGVREDAFPTAEALVDAIAATLHEGDPTHIVVILDAIDEVEDPPAMLAAVDALLPVVARNASVRVLVTLRAATLRAAPLLSNAHLFARFHDSESSSLVPFFFLPSLSGVDETTLVAAALSGSGARARRVLDAAAIVGRALAANGQDEALDPRRSAAAAELLAAGVLAPPPDDGRSEPGPSAFACGVVGEEIVARALDVGDPPSGELVAALAVRASNGGASRFVVRAVERVVRRLAHTGQGNALAWLLTVTEPFAGELLVTALVALGAAWEGEQGGACARAVLEPIAATCEEPVYAARFIPAARTASAALRAAGALAAARGVLGVGLRAVRGALARDESDELLHRNLADVLAELAELAVRGGRADEARKLHGEALRIERAFVEHRPDRDSLRRLAAALVASARAAQGRAPRDEKRLLDEVCAIAASSPTDEDVALLHADALDRLLERATESGDWAAARALAKSVSNLRERLVQAKSSDERLTARAASMRRVAEATAEAGDSASSQTMLVEAIALARDVVVREPGHLAAHAELCRALTSLAEHARSAGRRDEAPRLIAESVEGLSRVVLLAPSFATARRDLASALHVAGEIAILEGKRGRSRRLLTACIDEARAVGGADRTLARALATLGHVARSEGRHQEARACYAEAIRLFAPLVMAQPLREERVVALADLYLSASLVEQEEAPRARLLSQVIELLAPLRGRAAEGTKLERILDVAERALAARS